MTVGNGTPAANPARLRLWWRRGRRAPAVRGGLVGGRALGGQLCLWRTGRLGRLCRGGGGRAGAGGFGGGRGAGGDVWPWAGGGARRVVLGAVGVVRDLGGMRA